MDQKTTPARTPERTVERKKREALALKANLKRRKLSTNAADGEQAVPDSKDIA
jgi:hypothetical protein